jgi:hypothetical protein
MIKWDTKKLNSKVELNKKAYLIAAGEVGQNEFVSSSPVITGLLRNSISYYTSNNDISGSENGVSKPSTQNTVRIGSGIIYAASVEKRGKSAGWMSRVWDNLIKNENIMAIKDDIYTFLSAQSAVTALVPVGQMGWIDCDEETSYPRIVYKMISDPPLYQANDRWQRWRFYALSDSKDECRQIGDALYDALHGLQDNMGSTYVNVFMIDRTEVTREESIYEQYLDFRIIYVGE